MEKRKRAEKEQGEKALMNTVALPVTQRLTNDVMTSLFWHLPLEPKKKQPRTVVLACSFLICIFGFSLMNHDWHPCPVAVKQAKMPNSSQ